MNNIRIILEYGLKHCPQFYNLFNILGSLFMRIWGLFLPIDDNIIIFSGHGRKYNDSPKIIYEQMINQKKYKNLNYIWALEDLSTNIPGNPIKVKADSLNYFKYALKAKYWVTCVNIERGLHFKKKSTIYLNTWHGTPIKTIGNAAGSRNDFDFSAVDIFCSSGNYETSIFIRDLNVKPNKIILTGLPRNDEMYSSIGNDCKKIKEQLGIPLNKKIILYAPTWRDSNDFGKNYIIKPPIDLKLWREKLIHDYIVIFRSHAYTTKLMGLVFDDFIRDYSSYSNVNELLKISDILISDYSAIIFDFSILEKPIISFAYDYETYAQDRGIYLDLNSELPNGICHTEEEVLVKILNMNYSEESMKTKKFKNKYVQFGGNATNKCIEKLMINY